MPSQIQVIWSRADAILSLLGSEEALQLENQDMARVVIQELACAILSYENYLGEPEPLDLLVRLHDLDDALCRGDQQYLANILKHAAFLHLGRWESPSENPGYHLQKALEYYARAQSIIPDNSGVCAFQKLVAIGEVGVNRSAKHRKQMFQEDASDGSISTGDRSKRRKECGVTSSITSPRKFISRP